MGWLGSVLASMSFGRWNLARIGAVGLGLLGLGVSAALLVDSLGPDAAFCAADGCGAVRESAWARPLGVPMPLVGMVFFAVSLGLTVAGTGAARARVMVALLGGAGAVGLLAVQGLLIGEWCRLCVVVDAAALGLAAVAVGSRRQEWQRVGGGALSAAAAVAVVAGGGPFVALRDDGLVAVSRPVQSHSDLPAPIAREQRAGTVAVVDFVDFECPHCRAFHTRLTEAMKQVEAPVHVVRKMVPLPQHRGAMPAAIAWSCADAQGRGDEMAEALFGAPTWRLTPEGCAEIAAEIGLDLDRYRADAADPATRQRIAADLDDARAARVESLPTVYIGRHAFVGAGASVSDLVAAFRRAAAPS